MPQAQEPDDGAVQTAQPATYGVDAAAVGLPGPVLVGGRPVAPVGQAKADLVFAFMEAVAVFPVDMARMTSGTSTVSAPNGSSTGCGRCSR